MDDDQNVQNLLLDAMKKMPDHIAPGLLAPSSSPTRRMQYADLALRLLLGPSGRSPNSIDLENKEKAARMLTEALPALRAIRDAGKSDRTRKRAAKLTALIERALERHAGRQ